MPSQHFVTLEKQLNELYGIFLAPAIAKGAVIPSTEDGEAARAFLVFSHAELEHYIEQAFSSLADHVKTGAAAGKYSNASLAMLTFSNLETLSAGDELHGKALGRRIVSTRLVDAIIKYKKAVEENHGVREKYLSKLSIPLGLNGNDVSKTWLGDLDKYCEDRGAYAHKSRTIGNASPLSANPNDIWLRCKKLVWAPLPATGSVKIESFEELDAWIEVEKLSFGSLATGTPISVPTTSLGYLFHRITRKLIGHVLSR